MANLTITAASVVLVSGETASGTAGGTITAGMPVYIDAADSSKLKAGSAAAAASAACVGISLHAALDGQPLTYAKPGSVVTIGSAVVVGTCLVVSNTAGLIADDIGDLTTGMYPNIVGSPINVTDIKVMMENIAAAVA